MQLDLGSVAILALSILGILALYFVVVFVLSFRQGMKRAGTSESALIEETNESSTRRVRRSRPKPDDRVFTQDGDSSSSGRSISPALNPNCGSRSVMISSVRASAPRLSSMRLCAALPASRRKAGCS